MARVYLIFFFLCVPFLASHGIEMTPNPVFTSVPFPTSTPTALVRDRQLLESKFLQKLLKCPIFEDGGNTTEAFVLFDYPTLSKRISSEGIIRDRFRGPSRLPSIGSTPALSVTPETSFDTASCRLFQISNGYFVKLITLPNGSAVTQSIPSNENIYIPGQFQPVPIGQPVTVRYPAFGIYSVHQFQSTDQVFFFRTFLGGPLGSCIFTEMTSSGISGDYPDGLQLEYFDNHLCKIQSYKGYPPAEPSATATPNLPVAQLKAEVLTQRTHATPWGFSDEKGGLIAGPDADIPWSLTGGKCNGEAITETSRDPQGRIETFVAYWPSGNVQFRGTKDDGVETGTWYVGYPSGKKNALLQYDNEGNIKTAKSWTEEGTLFEEVVQTREKSNHPYKSDFNEYYVITYWNAKGQKVFSERKAVNTDYNHEVHTDYYWPDGTLAYQSREYSGGYPWADGESNFFGFRSSPVFKIGYIPPGNGVLSSSPAGPYMEVMNPDSGTTTLPDGPVTLWGAGQPEDLVNRPYPVSCRLTPLATGRIKNGKLIGHFHFDSDLCPFNDFHFRKGKLLEKNIGPQEP